MGIERRVEGVGIERRVEGVGTYNTKRQKSEKSEQQLDGVCVWGCVGGSVRGWNRKKATNLSRNIST